MKLLTLLLVSVAVLSSGAFAAPVADTVVAGGATKPNADHESRVLEPRAVDYHNYLRDNERANELNVRAQDYYNYRRDNERSNELNVRAVDYYNYRRDNEHSNELNVRAVDY